MTPNMFQREAKKILRRLAQKGARLSPCDDGYGLFTRRAQKATLHINADIVDRLKAHCDIGRRPVGGKRGVGFAARGA